MIGKDKLGFDVTDATTIAASDSVGAFVRSSNGTLITHTTVSGKQALDVNVANTLTVTNAANFAEDSAHTSGDIGVHILAVRNDAGGSLTSADGEYTSLQTDSQGRLRVFASATDLDIRDLSHAQDSVRIGDGTNFLAFVGSTGIARLADFHTTAANSAVSIDNTAGGTALVSTALSNRTNMFVQNLGNKSVFIGVGTVTAANGLRLAPNSTLELRAGAALNLKAIAQDSSAQDIRVLELA